MIRACQRFLPDHPITLLVDGDGKKYDWPDTIYFPDRLKHQRHPGAEGKHGGGAWLKRWFTFALESGCKKVLKVDPDSKIHRPFFSPPPDAELFGSILDSALIGRFLHGGSQGISASFMQKALPLLDDDQYLTRPFTMRNGTASSDKIIAHIAERLGVPLTPWKEVTYFPRPWNNARYAISHGRWHKE